MPFTGGSKLVMLIGDVNKYICLKLQCTTLEASKHVISTLLEGKQA